MERTFLLLFLTSFYFSHSCSAFCKYLKIYSYEFASYLLTFVCSLIFSRQFKKASLDDIEILHSIHRTWCLAMLYNTYEVNLTINIKISIISFRFYYIFIATIVLKLFFSMSEIVRILYKRKPKNRCLLAWICQSHRTAWHCEACAICDTSNTSSCTACYLYI